MPTLSRVQDDITKKEGVCHRSRVRNYGYSLLGILYPIVSDLRVWGYGDHDRRAVRRGQENDL